MTLKLSVRKRDWEPGKYQVLVYIRHPDGTEVCTQGDKFDPYMGQWAEEIQRAILRKQKPRNFWERILSLCSIHRDPDPNCKLCQATPKDIFPDWDDATAQAEVAGLTKCKKCGFEFYRTVTSCPACNHQAVPEIAETMNIAEEILGEEIVNQEKTKRAIEALYFHMRRILGHVRRLQGRENGEAGKR